MTKLTNTESTLKLPAKNRNSIIQEQDEDQHSQSSQRFVKSPGIMSPKQSESASPKKETRMSVMNLKLKK